MSLFVDQSAGVDTSGQGEPGITTDIFTISWDDGNVGEGAATSVAGSAGGIASIPVVPVTYNGGVTTGMATANRLFELVSTTTGANWNSPIVITPLFGGNDPYTGASIFANGHTYVDTAASPPVIHVVYDTSQAGGQGICVFDTSGNPISTPNVVILYHELSHAYHFALNQVPFPQSQCPAVTDDEPAAEIDENVLRDELGLCDRDVCNHGGQLGVGANCGGSETPGGPPWVLSGSGGSSGGGGGGCFIVTATMGSPEAYEIRRLRALRDRVSNQSSIARSLIAAIYAEYFQFSPAVAGAIAGDPAARVMVRQLVVQPLFAWYELAAKLGLGNTDPVALSAARTAVFDACRRELAGLVTPTLEALARGEPPPERIASFLGGQRDAIAKVAELQLAHWALVRPLFNAWTLSASGGDLDRGVAEWLAAAPLETLRPPPPRRLDSELRRLAELLAFAPDARLTLGARLDAAWPGRSELLRRHGFIEAPGDPTV